MACWATCSTLSRAREALDTADVVVVTGHGGAPLAYADVVLPAAVQHERLGTVTNIEGRVTAVAPKIVAPGSAWPDVAIASELAEELGQSIGLASVEQAAKTIEETTGYPALSVLNDSTSDGVVVGDVAEAIRASTARPDGLSRASDRPRPSASGRTPGPRSSPTSIRRRPTAAATLDDLARGRQARGPPRRRLLAARESQSSPLRRRHRRAGFAVPGHTEGRERRCSLNHFDLDRLGVATGDVVGVSGARGSIRLPVALDDAVPRGVAEIAFGSLDADGVDVVRPILDGGDVISQVRLESA